MSASGELNEFVRLLAAACMDAGCSARALIDELSDEDSEAFDSLARAALALASEKGGDRAAVRERARFIAQVHRPAVVALQEIDCMRRLTVRYRSADGSYPELQQVGALNLPGHWVLLRCDEVITDLGAGSEAEALAAATAHLGVVGVLWLPLDPPPGPAIGYYLAPEALPLLDVVDSAVAGYSSVPSHHVEVRDLR